MNLTGLQNHTAHLKNPYQDNRVSFVGHGRLESSTENLSALHVIAHELGHVQEFKNQAFQEGSEVRSVQVKINYEMRDGRMVAVSGETSATTQKRPESISKTDPSLEPYSDGKSFKDLFSVSKEEEDKKAKDKDRMNPVQAVEREKKEELESKIKDLEIRLESEKQKGKSSVGSDKTKSFEEDDKAKEIASEKRRLEEEVRLLKMKENLRETFDMLSDIRKLMVSNVFGMMQAGNESKSGNFLNTLI
ncbi:hypothetical protein [Leptospira idonii]|uniref:Uncharacterized protein n=1 Tax=Leptospira idonii TaxID=1193500 RepID=A0A4V6QMW9_9LEPT|nr:hypothetical protein [Leptospira idonii]TGN19426.1 hypothetical protein EHS15_08790 [Leptospira idonii]